MLKKLNSFHLFLLILVIGILARLISFVLLPESAYADSLFHLRLVENTLKTGIISTPDIFTTPLYYAVSFVFFSITRFPLTMPFIRIIPFLVFIFQIVVSFFLLKELFNEKKQWFLGLGFIAVFPWLVRYSPVNYVDQFASVFILLFFYAFIKLDKTKNPAVLALTPFILAGIALSKANATLLVPFLLIGLLYYLFKNKYSIKIIALIALTSIILSSFWFLGNFTQQGNQEAVDEADFGAPLSNVFTALLPGNLFLSYLSFFDFPPLTAFDKIPWIQSVPWFWTALGFFVIMLPIAITLLYGAFKSFKSNKVIQVLIALSCLVLFAFTFKTAVNGVIYTRYMMPVMPLLGILFVQGFDLLGKRINWKYALYASLILFAIGSLLLSSVSAYFYSGVYNQNKELYSEIQKLPEGSYIASMGKSREIYFYSGKEAGHPPSATDFFAPEATYQALKENDFTHLAVTCYNDYWNLSTVNALRDSGLLEKVFEKDCSVLYALK